MRRPTPHEIGELAERLGLGLPPEHIATFHSLVSVMLEGFDLLDAMPEQLPPVRYPREAATRPSPSEDRLGAWYMKTRVEGAGQGRLAGRSVVLKDNVMLAGVPLMNGTTILDGYVPPMDATIVERILDAGGTIVGKAVCEAYCFSGSSHTSQSGPVRNPHDPTRSAGGSSSGCGALVASGEVEMAIGGDQGGSIRMPASFCGIYGMKPTWGLVPYTGILSMEPTIDHAGPMTANVADNALLLEVIAGPDGLDSRQVDVPTDAYCAALDAGISGLRIGLLREGFGRLESEPDVDAKVRTAAGRFEKLGAKISDISLPIHATAGAICSGVLQSIMHTMLDTDGCGTGREDLLPTSFVEFHRRWRERADELPPTMKRVLLVSSYLREHDGYRMVQKSMNLMRGLRVSYDQALSEVDLLLLPTTPMKAPRLPAVDAAPEEVVAQALAPLGNTQPFDHTHHPAMSIPCGMSDGLPVGAMLVGRRFEEATIYRAARAFEQHEDWRAL